MVWWRFFDLGISAHRRGPWEVGAGLRTGGNGSEGMIATCVVVGLGRIGLVVRLGEGFDGEWFVGDIWTWGTW